MNFDLSKFRNEFLQSDGWKVSDCYKPYEDKFLRKDAQDAYEGAKWGFEAGQQSRQSEVDDLIDMVKTSADSEMYLFDELQKVNKDRNDLQKRIDEVMRLLQTRHHNADVTNIIMHMHKILKGNKND